MQVNLPDNQIALDPQNTVQGMMERIFIAEAHSPDHSDYDASQVLTEMRNMRQVFENRLKNPSVYEARGATDMIGIVTAPKQFEGFTNYPEIGTKMQFNIDNAMSVANGPPTPRQVAYQQFVQNAKLAASESIATPLAGYPNATAWVTKDTHSPGGNFFVLGSLGGNTFYGTLPPQPVSTKPPHGDPRQGKTLLEKLRHHAAVARANAAAKPVPEHMKLLMKLKALRQHQFPSFAPRPGRRPAAPPTPYKGEAPQAELPNTTQSLKKRLDDMLQKNPKLAGAVTAPAGQRSALQISMAGRAMLRSAIAAAIAAGVSKRAGTAGALAATMARSTLPSFVPPPRRHAGQSRRFGGSATMATDAPAYPSLRGDTGASEKLTPRPRMTQSDPACAPTSMEAARLKTEQQLEFAKALSDFLNHEARLPPSGGTAFNPYLTPAWPGQKIPG